MDDLKSVQQRWLDASRRHHAPSAAAVARMRKGLQARIAAGEPAPVWRVETPLEAAAPPSARWRPWVIGGGVLLAAAVALLWASRGSITMVAQTDSPNAAAYDADHGVSGGTPIIPVDRRSPTTRPAAAPPVE
ncbi:MAG: hypothetical protein K0V04_27565 [Deltaproteobacteria bacterium]|nr:hypothetical protein [Deltaproteobacteria bacterium]